MYNTWRKKSRSTGWLQGERRVSMVMPSWRHSACSCWNSTSETYCLNRSLVMFTHSWNAHNIQLTHQPGRTHSGAHNNKFLLRDIVFYVCFSYANSKSNVLLSPGQWCRKEWLLMWHTWPRNHENCLQLYLMHDVHSNGCTWAGTIFCGSIIWIKCSCSDTWTLLNRAANWSQYRKGGVHEMCLCGTSVFSTRARLKHDLSQSCEEKVHGFWRGMTQLHFMPCV